MSVDYDKEEAALDAEILAMQGITPPAPETDTAETTTINAEPAAAETSADDQISQDETQPELNNSETAEETVAKSRYDNAVKRMTQATQEAADLRREIAALQADKQQFEERLKSLEQAKPPEADSAPEVDLELYPELEPLLKRNQALEQQVKKLEESLNGVQQHTARAQQQEAQNAQKAHFDAIRSAHPDVDTIAQDEGFAEWLKEQPPMVQYGASQGTAKDVIRVLDLYKAETQPERPDNASRLAAARQASTPTVPKSPVKPSSNKPQFTREQIAKMTMEEFAKNEGLIDQALAEGRVF